MAAIPVSGWLGRTLVPPVTFDLLSAWLIADQRMAADRAERAIDQALAYLATVAETREVLVLSAPVDAGVRALVLHTTAYHLLCTRLGGRYLHYAPPIAQGGRAPEALARTMTAIAEEGYVVDRPLWSSAAT